MKILITEVLLNGYNSSCNVKLDSNYLTTWNDSIVEYNITPELLNELKEKGVVGWVKCKSNNGEEALRTYMLLPV